MTTRHLVIGILSFALVALLRTADATAQAVVTDGRITNVYVWPIEVDPNWDDYVINHLHMNTAFTRENIDRAAETLINGASPSYFDALKQYGIHVPVFFGSTVAPAECVQAALHDAQAGVLEYDTIRSLANCHGDGLDPSPQLNLIFSPDLQVGDNPNVPLTAHAGDDICKRSGTHTIAWHGWGLNMPNFAVIPLEPGCVNNFGDLTANLSHEDVEMLSDPGQTGHGAWGGSELADQCENGPSRTTTFAGLKVSTYFSDKGKACMPKTATPAPPPANEVTLLDISGNNALGGPLKRLTNDSRELTLSMNDAGEGFDSISIRLFTGNDDLRGGGDDVDLIVKTKSGCVRTLTNANNGAHWEGWTIHTVPVTFSACPTGIHDVNTVTIRITEGSHSTSPDNWNLQRVKITGVPTVFFKFSPSTPTPKSPDKPVPQPN